MSRNIWIGVIVVIVLGAGWWYFNESRVLPASETTPTSPALGTTSGTKTFANTQYGVSLQYPSSVQINTSPSYTSSYSTSPDDWWWYPFTNNATNLFSATSQGDVVLLAVSNNSSDVAKCNDSTLGKTVSIGGVSFQELDGTDGSNYGASFVIYRTTHNNLCYAVARTINLGWRNQKATDQNSQLLDSIAQSLRFN